MVTKEIADYLNQLEMLIENNNINLATIKTGKGIRNPQIVKDYLLLTKYLIKFLSYEEQNDICGPNRNSYYKTDHDATAMCLKKDYYSGLGSNLHAGYNVQILVSKGFILHFSVFQDRNDYFTLIPIINEFKDLFSFYPKRLCADAGYSSYKNYKFVFENNIECFIKPSDWSSIVNGTQVNLYNFDEEQNLICLNNKKAIKIKDASSHLHKPGCLYLIENCSRCKYKFYCHSKLKKKENRRFFEASYEYSIQKEKTISNLLSKKGIKMRVNRSSQVEGAFGVIKQDMDYERVRRRGLENVSTEIMLVCLGYVIKKLFSLLNGKAKLDYWVAPESLVAETLHEVDITTLKTEPKNRGKNAKLRKSYKRKKGVRNS